MEFDEIVVKESPGLCRCCLSEGCYKDLGSEYAWMNDREVYADMLLECFDISISQQNEGPNGPNRLICEVCITRLRDACNFKKQVLDSEKKFIDMIGRGEFRPKVLIYQSDLKAEQIAEEPAPDAEEIEYLDEDIDFGDNAETLESDSNQVPVEDITVSALPVKGKRGRPRKNPETKPEKKPKVAKTEKARTSKVGKGEKKKQDVKENYIERLSSVRRNVQLILHYGNVLPFSWNTKGFRCFYCSKVINNCELLRKHCIRNHSCIDLTTFIPQRIITKDIPLKIDVIDLACKVCNEEMKGLEDLIEHIITFHGDDYDKSAENCFIPFWLKKDSIQCVLCKKQYDNYASIVTHMNKEHIPHPFICQVCGESYARNVKLQKHITNCHLGHKCNKCDKVFDALHKFNRHNKVVHGKVTEHACSLCSSTFESDYQFKVHLGKVHNVEKFKIKCKLCPKICTTKGAMRLHEQAVHPVVKFQCDLCDYKTGIKWMIKLHRRKHFGERDYTCGTCGKCFGRASNLRTHMKVHTGNVGRVCRWCRQGFVDGDALKEHESNIHHEQM